MNTLSLFIESKLSIKSNCLHSMLGFNLGFPTRQINICIMYLKEVQLKTYT